MSLFLKSVSQYSTNYSVYDREAWEMIQIASIAYLQIFVPHQQICVKLLVPQIVQPNWNCHEVKKHYTLIYGHSNSLLWDNRNKLGKVKRDWGLFTYLFWQKSRAVEIQFIWQCTVLFLLTICRMFSDWKWIYLKYLGGRGVTDECYSSPSLFIRKTWTVFFWTQADFVLEFCHLYKIAKTE